MGNFVYKHYLKSYLVYDKEKSKDILNVHELNSLQNIDENFDKCVVICANQISIRDGALLPFYDFFKSTKLPIMLLGLGAQSDLDYSMDFLKNIPNHIKLLQLLSRKKAIIGCRGKFSYNVLKKIGFENVFVIGCPSFYKNGLDFKIKKKDVSLQNLKIDISFDWFRNRELWYNLVTNTQNFKVICQSAPELALWNLSKNQENIDDLKMLENLFNVKQEVITKNKKLFQNNVSLFFSVDEWENFIKNRDFYIGPKIHGCLMHILNGIPGFLIAHDSRTREFAELFNIPHIFSSRLSQSIDIKNIYFTYDESKLKKQYNKLFYNYLCFLDKCGLKYNFKVKSKNILLYYKLKFYINNFLSHKFRFFDCYEVSENENNYKKVIKFLGVEIFKKKNKNFKISKYILGVKYYTSLDIKACIECNNKEVLKQLFDIKDEIAKLKGL